jgi:MscS family membrane protein
MRAAPWSMGLLSGRCGATIRLAVYEGSLVPTQADRSQPNPLAGSLHAPGGLSKNRLVKLGWMLTPLVALSFVGQAAAAADEAIQLEHPLARADTSSPRDTLKSFIDSCNYIFKTLQRKGRGRETKKELATVLNRVMSCLDLSQVPEFRRETAGREAAVCLKEVLDRIKIPEWKEIPDIVSLQEATDIDHPDRWTLPDTEITLVRVPDGPRQGEYLFSADTVERAADFFQRVRQLPYRTTGPETTPGWADWYLSEPGSAVISSIVRKLPAWFRVRKYGLAPWQWIGLITTILGAAIAIVFSYKIGRRLAADAKKTGVLRYCVTVLFLVAAALIPLIARNFIETELAVAGTLLSVVKFSANVMFLFAIMVLLIGTGNRVAEIIISAPHIHPKGMDAQFIRMVCRVIGLGAATIVFLEGGQFLGIPLTTLLAGAGVGGLAIALSAQDTLKNLFGSMMIFLDKPYRVGERIVVKNYDGTVAEIGLRSTKIRLLTGHMAAIPNEEMARSHIENIGRRPHVRRVQDISIPFDTPPEKVEQALKIVRDALDQHQGMEPDFPPRVFFTQFNRDALNLRFMYWFHPPDYWEFLAFGEKLNLRILHEFEAAEIPFALPSTANFLKTLNQGESE